MYERCWRGANTLLDRCVRGAATVLGVCSGGAGGVVENAMKRWHPGRCGACGKEGKVCMCLGRGCWNSFLPVTAPARGGVYREEGLGGVVGSAKRNGEVLAGC